MIYVPPYAYKPLLSLRETEIAIKKVKDYFEQELAKDLRLTRVSAPMFVDGSSGLNDNLNGTERPVTFSLRSGEEMEIVHSLAKWKRMALKTYGFAAGEGLYTDMNAIRRDEAPDAVHSLYVDQWDWEKIIRREERTAQTLEQTVRTIYDVLRRCEMYVAGEYRFIEPILPASVTVLTTQELEDAYPALSPKEREYRAVKEFGAVFLRGIGGRLRSGAIHDGRAPDYDDWTLNGDILVYYPILDMALELSSMGVRVDEARMRLQLAERGCPERAKLPFHRALLAGELPDTIGGGIGQSRLCMFFLRKAHIGEVQSSYWPGDMAEACRTANIPLL